jgi:hypothetical protein
MRANFDRKRPETVAQSGLEKTAALDMVSTHELPGRRFAIGEVSKSLGIPRWRLQKFLSSRHYRLRPHARFGGVGSGSRLMFSVYDAVRMGLAAHLLRDGFAPHVVADVLEEIDPEVVSGIVRHPDGAEESVEWGLALERGSARPVPKKFPWHERSGLNQPFYLLNLRALIEGFKSQLGVLGTE